MKRVQIKIGLSVILLAYCLIVYAEGDKFNKGFDQGIQSATALQGSGQNAIQNFHPEKIIDNYSQNPKEVNYQTNSNAIQTDAVMMRENNKDAKSIENSIQNHPVFNIRANSPFIQNIKKQSDDVYDAVANQFSNCTKQTKCNITYQTQICEEAPKSTYQHCNKKLTVDLISNDSYTDYAFTASFSTRWHNYASAIFNLTTGDVIDSGPRDLVASLSGRLPLAVNAASMSVYSRDKDNYITGFSLADKNINISLSGYPKNATIHFVIRVTTTTLSQSDKWDDGCLGFSNLNSCQMKDEHCIDANTTHTIQGQSVTRDCWEKEATYLCGNVNTDSSCEPLRAESCEQINSECENKIEGTCVKYKQTFRCPTKQCTDVGMICNNQTYCLNGDCVKKQNQADPDFQRAVSALSVSNEAAKNFSQFNSIFKGEKKTCDTFSLGFLDCCSDTGWGKDHVANCTQEEKDLKTAKDNLMTVYVGEYCKKDALGSCFEKRKAYCVFPSKLARIIQDQGRRGQLNLNFGDAENANCRGITREEFARLNLNVMDFSDFYSEIYKREKIEDREKLNARIMNKMQTLPKGIEYV